MVYCLKAEPLVVRNTPCKLSFSVALNNSHNFLAFYFTIKNEGSLISNMPQKDAFKSLRHIFDIVFVI